MSASSQFTVAVHTLVMLALEERPLSSPYIANSVNTNPVVIRRILGPLNEAGFIDTKLGAEGGAYLVRDPETISLLDVYRAIHSGSLFALHNKNPNPQCPCGRNIQPVLNTVFGTVEDAMEAKLAETTIADLTEAIIKREPMLTS